MACCLSSVWCSFNFSAKNKNITQNKQNWNRYEIDTNECSCEQENETCYENNRPAYPS